MDVILKKRLRQLAVVVLLATILPYVSFPLTPHFLFVVAADSMSPTINCGDIVVIFDSTVSNGSIVVFRNPINEGYQVHRICGVQRVGNRTYYVTKGDMVNQTDSFLIPQENVVGVVSVIVPYIGLHYLIPRLHTLLITMFLIVLYVTIAFYETRRWSLGKEPEDKTSRNRNRLSFNGQKKPIAKKIGAAALALFLIIVLVQPPLMQAGINMVYPQSQHSATVTTPKIALQNGIAGSSTIGDGGNSATVSVAAPVPTYYPSGYNVLSGTYMSGTVPPSVQTVDSNYLIIRSVASGTAASACYPSGYTLGGSTTWISGGISNLTSNDDVYMTFRSYQIAQDLQYTESEAENTTSSTSWQDKVVLTWNAPTTADYLIIATAEVATSSTSAGYQAEAQITIDGTAYSVHKILSNAANDYLSFFAIKRVNLAAGSHTVKIKYRSAVTIATAKIRNAHLLVWSKMVEYAESDAESSTSSTTFQNKTILTFTPSEAADYLVIGTALISGYTSGYPVEAKLTIDGTEYGYSYIDPVITRSYNYYSFGTIKKIGLSAASHTIIIRWRSTNGILSAYIKDARIVALKLGTSYYSEDESETSTTSTTPVDKVVNTYTPSAGDYLTLGTIQTRHSSTSSIGHANFNLSATENHHIFFTPVSASNYFASVFMKKRILTNTSTTDKIQHWVTADTQYSKRARLITLETPPPAYKSEVEFTDSSNTYTWIQLSVTVDSSWTTNSIIITIQVYNWVEGQYPTNGQGYLNYTSGAANTDETKTLTITTNPQDFRNAAGNWKVKVTGSGDVQFDFKADWIEYKPTYYSEYMVSTEFLFSNMTNNTPTQLNFTVVSEYDIASVNVTIQVWNYSSSAYVTSGEGYLTYTSAGANETKLLSINTNPQLYTSAGYAKINVTGVKTTTTQFQQDTNQIKLDYSYGASSSYDYVLKVVNQVTYDWKVNLKVYDSSTIGRLSSATISLHDGTTSTQIIVSGGVITQSEGALYDLAGSATIYISMNNLQATTSETSSLYVYLKAEIPNSGVHVQLQITFQIT